MRDDFERLLCGLNHWLSCKLDCIHVCVFYSQKTSFKKWLDTSSIPPWHLVVCRASQDFSYRNPDTSSTPNGSIEKALVSSIASQHLVDRSSFCSWIWWVVPRYLFDTLAINDHFLDTFLDTCIYRALLRVYIYFLRDLFLISSISLDLSAPVHPPNTLSLSHSKHLPLWFFKLFQDSPSLCKFLNSHSSCISCFET